MMVCRIPRDHFFGCEQANDEHAGEQRDEIYAVFVDILRDVGALVDAAQLDTEPGISISSPGQSFG